MEDTENMNFLFVREQVDDAIVPPKQDPRLPPGLGSVRVAEPKKVRQQLRLGIDGLDNLEGSARLVAGNVVVDLAEPLLRFLRPDYFRQDSIRWPISSCEIVRPASESARPLSTIAANANSRRISSRELSSG